MAEPRYSAALIVGAGTGLSAALARRFAKAGMRVGLAARDTEKLTALASEIQARTFRCDATIPAGVDRLFEAVDRDLGAPDVVVYNPALRVRGPLLDLDPADVARALSVGAFGGFLVAQQAARRMLPKHHGAILFTGASASLKGFAQSAPFAMGKFALRGLAQSLARELAPQGIHVAHIVIDGPIRPPDWPQPQARPDSMLEPDAIAETYLSILAQPRSAWTFEIELRPWVETF
jgi:NAD(P)-dependent dehydrogenase (short-subunit alcohol dehydrogenase family)